MNWINPLRRRQRHLRTLRSMLVALFAVLTVAALAVVPVPNLANAQPVEVVADTSRTEPGIVVTNNHVIRGTTTTTATNVGNGRTYEADVLGYDRKSDVAVLQLRAAEGVPVAPTADSSAVRVGDPVAGVGFP